MSTYDMTHEELANEAIRAGRARKHSALIRGGRRLLALVEAEKDSHEQAAKVIALLNH